MKLVSCVRQKNGLKYLPRLIKQLHAVSDVIVILDDNSTDGSVEYLKQFSDGNQKFFVIKRKDGYGYSGGLDWNAIHSFISQFSPDWVYTPDVDELLDEEQQGQLRALAEQSGKDILGWSFPFYYLWNDEEHYRDDDKYFNTKVIRLFRYDKDLRPPTRDGHATAVPDTLDRRMIRVANMRMKHFGYMLEEDRKAKYDFYTGRDKDPEEAGSGGKDYSHMLTPISTLPLVPPLQEWVKSYTGERNGNHLRRCPLRLSVGAPFPTADEITLENLVNVPNNSVDEFRISYCIDSMSAKEVKDIMAEAYRILRPGGRFEVIGTDFVTLCEDFVKGDYEVKISLQRKFIMATNNTRREMALCREIVAAFMGTQPFYGAEQVALGEFPHRLYMMCYKPGDVRWV